jgi:hypothetical protein
LQSAGLNYAGHDAAEQVFEQLAWYFSDGAAFGYQEHGAPHSDCPKRQQTNYPPQAA